MEADECVQTCFCVDTYTSQQLATRQIRADHVMLCKKAAAESKQYNPVCVPKRLVMIKVACDYSLKVHPEGIYIVNTPGDPWTGITCCDTHYGQAVDDIAQYCKLVGACNNFDTIPQFSAAKMLRSSGKVDEGWIVSHTSFDTDMNRLMINCRTQDASLTKACTLEVFCTVNDMSVEDTLAKIIDCAKRHAPKLCECGHINCKDTHGGATEQFAGHSADKATESPKPPAD